MKKTKGSINNTKINFTFQTMQYVYFSNKTNKTVSCFLKQGLKPFKSSIFSLKTLYLTKVRLFFLYLDIYL